jgi:hypothetical protein
MSEVSATAKHSEQQPKPAPTKPPNKKGATEKKAKPQPDRRRLRDSVG